MRRPRRRRRRGSRRRRRTSPGGPIPGPGAGEWWAWRYRTDSMDSEPATGGEGPPEEPTPAGFGWWPSRWSPAMTAAGKVSRSELQADNGSLFWCESRPGDGGGQVVVRSSGGTPAADVSPPGVSVRSRVHEYGGGSATVWGGALFYIDQS